MRGTTNGNVRGSSYNRRSRRAWLMVTYASNIPGFVRCYRCGVPLFNPDAPPDPLDVGVSVTRPGELMVWSPGSIVGTWAQPLTADRIIPGCQGGTYRRDNIRPACGPCNSETGGGTRGKRKS